MCAWPQGWGWYCGGQVYDYLWGTTNIYFQCTYVYFNIKIIRNIKIEGSGALAGKMLDLGALKISCGGVFFPYFKSLWGTLSLRRLIIIPLTMGGKANL